MYSLLQSKSLSIVVPVYNEPQLVQKLHKLANELKPYFVNYEVIVVRDGCKDFEKKEMEEVCDPHIQIYHYKKNRGKGFALKYGVSRSTGDYIVFLDGGMELHPSDIKRFLLLMEAYEADIVIGSKRHPFSEVDYPFYRKFFSAGCQFLIRILFRMRFVRDSQVGLKLFRKNVLEKILPKTTYNDYAFDIELLVLAYKAGFRKILEAPVKLEFSSCEKKNILGEVYRLMRISIRVVAKMLLLSYRLNFSSYYKDINKANWGIPKELQAMHPMNNVRVHKDIEESKINSPSKVSSI